jgi:hypothetical protein
MRQKNSRGLSVDAGVFSKKTELTGEGTFLRD